MSKTETKKATKTDYRSASDEAITVDLAPFLMPLAIVVAAIIISISMYLSAGRLTGANLGFGGAGSDNEVGNDLPSDAPAAAAPQIGSTSIDDDTVKGDLKKAKVAIVEFSDYSCPFCQRFYSETLPQLQSEYIDKGDVAFVYRDLPLPSLHPSAQVQAEAAECAGEQGKYFEFHNGIFESPSFGSLQADGLKAIASDIGLDTGKFNSCLDNGDMADEVNKDATDAAAAGINGTPGFFIGKLDKDGNVDGEVLSGAQPFAKFQEVVEKYM